MHRRDASPRCIAAMHIVQCIAAMHRRTAPRSIAEHRPYIAARDSGPELEISNRRWRCVLG